MLPTGPCREFLDCCPKDAFQSEPEKQLADRLLFPQRPPTELVMFWVRPNCGGRSMGWLGENRLSAATAKDLLHLFHHMAGEVMFQTVEVNLPGAEDWGMDPMVVDLLQQPQFRLHAQRLVSALPGGWSLSLSNLKAFGQLVEYQRMAVDGKIKSGDVPELQRLVSKAGRRLAGTRRELSLQGNCVDALVQHLTTGVTSLKGAVPKTGIETRSWPTTCPRGAATETKWDNSGQHHHYQMQNAHSGESFKVVLSVFHDGKLYAADIFKQRQQ